MEKIISKYQSGEITIEEANAELAKIGAGFHLEEGKGPGWTEAEMAAGFTDAPEEKTPVLPEKPDMRRRTDLKGQTVIQKTGAGEFRVTYDENGYAVRAFRAGWVPPDSGEEG